MRLIDADALKTWFGEKDLYTYDYIVGTINDAPTIEPEKKRGKWGEHGECPFCDYLRQWRDDKFCANCGAKMEEENV